MKVNRSWKQLTRDQCVMLTATFIGGYVPYVGRERAQELLRHVAEHDSMWSIHKGSDYGDDLEAAGAQDELEGAVLCSLTILVSAMAMLAHLKDARDAFRAVANADWGNVKNAPDHDDIERALDDITDIQLSMD